MEKKFTIKFCNFILHYDLNSFGRWNYEFNNISAVA